MFFCRSDQQCFLQSALVIQTLNQPDLLIAEEVFILVFSYTTAHETHCDKPLGIIHEVWPSLLIDTAERSPSAVTPEPPVAASIRFSAAIYAFALATIISGSAP